MTACGIQLTGGAAAANGRDPVTGLTASATTQAIRKSKFVAGVRLGSEINHGLTLRHAMLHGGYDWLIAPGFVAIEPPGVDLGVGVPMEEKFTKVGRYFGTSAATRIRFTSGGDQEQAFNIGFAVVEFVLTPRVGMWMPSEGSGSSTLVGEWAVEVGLRLALGSDLFTSPQGRVSDGTQPVPATPGDVP